MIFWISFHFCPNSLLGPTSTTVNLDGYHSCFAFQFGWWELPSYVSIFEALLILCLTAKHSVKDSLMLRSSLVLKQLKKWLEFFSISKEGRICTWERWQGLSTEFHIDTENYFQEYLLYDSYHNTSFFFTDWQELWSKTFPGFLSLYCFGLDMVDPYEFRLGNLWPGIFPLGLAFNTLFFQHLIDS